MKVSASEIWKRVGEESANPPSMEDLASFWTPYADGGRAEFSRFIQWATKTSLVRQARVYQGLQQRETPNRVEYAIFLASCRACEIARQLQEQGYPLDDQLKTILRQEASLRRLVSQ